MVAVACLANAPSAKAQVLERFVHGVADEFCESNQWPYPYYFADRHAVRSAFAMQVEAGWRAQNLLADHHFQPATGELTEAGRLLVHWIAFECPSQHRVIYVRRTAAKDEAQARVNAVNQYLASLPLEGNMPSILETNISPPGYPSGWPVNKDSISRKFNEVNLPDSKLYLKDRTPGGSSNGGK
jgi:hypothetical protein